MRYIFFLVIISIALIASCQIESQNAYVRAVEKERFTKDSLFKFSGQSPIPPQYQRQFMSLNYYEPDETYKVNAKLQRFEDAKLVTLRNNFNSNEDYYKIGKVFFNLKGQDYALTLLKSARLMDDPETRNIYFLPFTDKTNGKETYQTGRYIDIIIEDDRQKQLVIDFNKAYNPYCAYSKGYTCPLPPPENSMPIKIEAGELIFD